MKGHRDWYRCSCWFGRLVAAVAGQGSRQRGTQTWMEKEYVVLRRQQIKSVNHRSRNIKASFNISILKLQPTTKSSIEMFKVTIIKKRLMVDCKIEQEQKIHQSSKPQASQNHKRLKTKSN
jgi:hypothetical protein